MTTPSDKMIMLSTGTCFDDAHEIIMDPRLIPKSDLEYARVVHGLVSRKGQKKDIYAHCWTIYNRRFMEIVIDQEDGERCVLSYNKTEFLNQYTIYDQTAYTIPELIEAGLKDPIKASGPYKIKYLRKCSDWDKVKHLYLGRKK